MPEPRHWYLILYDVSDRKALRQVHKTLKAWGESVQYSVFRVRCTNRELEQLRFELVQIMGDEDRLMVVRLCPNCASRVTIKGESLIGFEPEPPPFQIV
ncbi:MAG: CRISPR-associated endonuclease Cas2 [Myxococcales bacterium]|nr:CRISPR-associated endonuclease Cas2 [Myxococcales bacterium]